MTKPKLSPKVWGVLALTLFVLVGLVAFQKERVATWLTFGDETLAAEFSNRDKLIGDNLTYDDTVKMNGVVIGKVTTIEQTDHGTMIAHFLVDRGTRAKLGSAPTAFIRPTLVTDGVEYVGLQTGGDPNQEFTADVIPPQRTTNPVYLDDVAKALSSEDAQKGVRALITQTDSTLRQGGSDAIRALVTDAPADLRPAGTVLAAFRGTNPTSDLTHVVEGFESVSDAFNRTQGQFSSTLRSLNATTAALSAGSRPLADAIASGPETLRVAQAGFADLRPALHRLRRTSQDFRPSAQRLSDVLRDLRPVLHRTRRVVHDLRQVARDARPLLRDVVRAADEGNPVLEDIKGSVLDRVNGPIKDRIYAPFQGKNEYKGTNIPFPTYQELAWLLSASSNVWKHYDANTAIARLEAGGGGQSVGGAKFPRSIEEYLEAFGLQQPEGPNTGPRNGPARPLTPGKIDPNKLHPRGALPDLSSSDLPMLGGNR